MPLFHLTWLPVIISCFPNSISISVEKDINQEMLLDLLYISSSLGVPIQDYERCFQIRLTAWESSYEQVESILQDKEK